MLPRQRLRSRTENLQNPPAGGSKPPPTKKKTGVQEVGKSKELIRLSYQQALIPLLRKAATAGFLETVGIYRTAPKETDLKQYFDKIQETDVGSIAAMLSPISDPSLTAGLIKRIIRHMDPPLIPKDTQVRLLQAFNQAAKKAKTETELQAAQKLAITTELSRVRELKEAGDEKRIFIALLSNLNDAASTSEDSPCCKNRMTATALSTSVAPSLFSDIMFPIDAPPDPAIIPTINTILKVMIDSFSDVRAALTSS